MSSWAPHKSQYLKNKKGKQKKNKEGKKPLAVFRI